LLSYPCYPRYPWLNEIQNPAHVQKMLVHGGKPTALPWVPTAARRDFAESNKFEA
jgi:hypothetical protein